MKKKRATPKEDEIQAAVRVGLESTQKHEKPLPDDFEAAWKEWSAGIAGVDARGMLLLRAAFEAGAETGKAR